MGAISHITASLLLSWAAPPAAEAVANRAAEPYAGDTLVEVELPDRAAVVTLDALGLDVWTEHPRPGGKAWVRVPVEQAPILAASSLTTRVVVPDLGSWVRAERLRLETEARPIEDGFYLDFRTFDAIDQRLDALVEAHPDRASIVEAGQSLEGRPIRALHIDASPDEDAPAVLIQAGQHAREWIAMSTGICVGERLLARAQSDPEVAQWLDAVEVLVVPVSNPDGYVHSWEAERFWRKNRRGEFGVDTNRNYDLAFGGPGASPEPEAGNYHGEAAFSEPESQAIRDLMGDFPNLISHVDLHSFGQLILHPWGYTSESSSQDELFEMLSLQMSEAMAVAHGTEYIPLQGAELYPAAGTAPDWSYGRLGLYAFTFELRPSSSDEDVGTGFELEPEAIEAVCDETLDGLEVLIRWSAGATPSEPGDDGGFDGGSTSGDATTTGPSTTGDATSSSSSDSSPLTTTDGSTSDASPPPGGTAADGADSTGSGGPEPSAEGMGASGCGCDAKGRPISGLLLLLLGMLVRSRSRKSC